MDGVIGLSELALSDSVLSECALDYLDERCAKTEFDLAARAKLLSLLEISLVK